MRGNWIVHTLLQLEDIGWIKKLKWIWNQLTTPSHYWKKRMNIHLKSGYLVTWSHSKKKESTFEIG